MTCPILGSRLCKKLYLKDDATNRPSVWPRIHFILRLSQDLVLHSIVISYAASSTVWLHTSNHISYNVTPFNSYVSCRIKYVIRTILSGSYWNYGPSLHENNYGNTTFRATDSIELNRFYYVVSRLHHVDKLSVTNKQ